jgi:hypothetical protein
VALAGQASLHQLAVRQFYTRLAAVEVALLHPVLAVLVMVVVTQVRPPQVRRALQTEVAVAVHLTAQMRQVVVGRA